ncbi:unnamed protein product [Sympodiomycopsis kandeliae]
MVSAASSAPPSSSTASTAATNSSEQTDSRTSSSKRNSASNRQGASVAVHAGTDPLSPVMDGDVSEADPRRLTLSDTNSSSSTIQPSASSSSSTGLFGTSRRDSDGNTSIVSPLDTPVVGNGSERTRNSVYLRHGSIDDGHKSGWAAYTSTEHLNPVGLGHENEYGRHSTKTRSQTSSYDEQGGASEDQDEARQVQMNLERWAAAEKQRRKAARTSRSSFLGPPETGNLARRLTFGRKPSSNVDESKSSSSSSAATDRESALLRKGSAGTSLSSNDSMHTDSRRGSGDSSQKLTANGSPTRSLTGQSLEDVPEDDNVTLSSNGRAHKGKNRAIDENGEGEEWGKGSRGTGRADQSPFADPSEFPRQSASSKRASLKPSASRPIVTPGRAPSIRRTPTNTPQIIATDVDAQQEKRNSRRHRDGQNPFLSASEAAVEAAEKGGHYNNHFNDHESDIGLPSMNRTTTSDSLNSLSSTSTIQQPKRMSMSKFREVGLDLSEGEEESTLSSNEIQRRRELKRTITRNGQESDSEDDERDHRSREANEDRMKIKQGKGRQPWWTEWICGCGRVIDDDNEQTGKTGPE